MDEIIKYHFRLKLLGRVKRIMNECGKIVEVYDQPERLNPEDVSDDVCDSLNFCESKRGESEEVCPPYPYQDGHEK